MRAAVDRELRVRARIVVFPRPEILDPEGKALEGALERMGFQEVREVRAGKTFDIELVAADADAARSRVEEMCQKLLANTIIEDYSFVVEEVEG